MSRFLNPKCESNFMVTRVSSHNTTSASLSVSIARKVMSLRLPIGVATMDNVGIKEFGSDSFKSSGRADRFTEIRHLCLTGQINSFDDFLCSTYTHLLNTYCAQTSSFWRVRLESKSCMAKPIHLFTSILHHYFLRRPGPV